MTATSQSPDLQQLLKIATDTARSAGEILLQGRTTGFGEVDTKTSAVDVVTETDKLSEQHITETLMRLRPEDGLLGEEGALKESKTGVRWVIDPLDGTVNFVYGIPFYAVSIGAEIDGEPVVGAVYNPEMREMFSGAKGNGAFLNDKPIKCSEQSDPHLSLLGTGFSYDTKEREVEGNWLAKQLGEFRDIRRTGSAALDVCFVASGRIDVYAQSFVKDWDVCAGLAIARAAGAEISYEKADGKNREIIVANSALFASIEKLVSPLPRVS